MIEPVVGPYGSWPSPITAALLVRGASRITEVRADPVRAGLLWWAESRPDEGGRTAVMCCDLGRPALGRPARSTGRLEADSGLEADSRLEADSIDAGSVEWGDAASVREVTPTSADVRTRVHEYGGGAWWPHDGALYYVEFADQRLRRLDPGGEPLLLTPEPTTPAALRYADGRVTPDGRRCICVRERHDAGTSEPANELVAVASDGSQRVEVLWSGADFVMTPRVSPDGTMLAWISWDHPNMPWDATRLHVHELGSSGSGYGVSGSSASDDGASGSSGSDSGVQGDSGSGDAHGSLELGAEVLVVGGDGDRSLCEPDWITADVAAGSRLLVCSDHDDWWGLYEVGLPGRDVVEGSLAPVVVGEFDVATPPWVFGMQRWTSTGSAVIAAVGLPEGDALAVRGIGSAADGICRTSANGIWHAAADSPDSSIASLTALRIADDDTGGEIAAVAYAGAGYSHETEVVALTIPSGGEIPKRRVVRPARELSLAPGFMVAPEAVTFPTMPVSDSTDSEALAHALYYPPTNPDCVGPTDGRPPLMVLAHGGPTGSARRELQLGVLYWTSRGFAVVDVDYRGSTGYGRSYRRALNGAWGVADVHDCVTAARFLAERGDVDPERLVIRGSSAGGFTVLAALAFHDVFAAGASRYGVADLESLAYDTHKFESRYLDTLVGPWPEARHLYAQRSPVRHLDGFDAPMIVLQGAEDEIVPPSQAEMIVQALRDKGVKVSYVLFEGEQHGFRRAENIVAALEAELAFFASVLGFSADLRPEDSCVRP